VIEFYQPTSPGEWVAFSSALLTLVWGLGGLVLNLANREARAERALLAGFMTAGALVAIMMAQPLLYLALGAAFALALLFGLIVKVRHGIAGAPSWGVLAGCGILAAMPLAYVFGYVP
jgi:hypothetical protein